MSAETRTDRTPLDYHPDRRYYANPAADVYAAPGCVIFMEAYWSGGKQTIAVDPDEVDELARQLHRAKRHARSAGSRP